MDMKKQSYILRSNGKIEYVEPKNGTDFSLEELKAAIGGGYIETVPIQGVGTGNGNRVHKIMVVDDEGALPKGNGYPLPLNTLASMIYGAGRIHGDVLICLRSQIK